jgi:hypothetical protein
MNYFLIK